MSFNIMTNMQGVYMYNNINFTIHNVYYRFMHWARYMYLYIHVQVYNLFLNPDPVKTMSRS